MNRREKVLRVLELVNEHDPSIGVQIEQEQPNTFVKLTATAANGPVFGRGWSKVCFPDTWNPERGAEIAMGKAAKSIVIGVNNLSESKHDKNDAH